MYYILYCKDSFRTLDSTALCVGETSAHPQGVVPWGRADGRAVRWQFDSADAVLMAKQDGDTISLQHVPRIDGVVIVTSEE